MVHVSNLGPFKAQEFHKNHTRISQKSVHIHMKNTGNRKISRVPKGALDIE
jgi:hypothetical protein